MNVSIDPRWEKLVGELVATGRYGSPGEVVREGLRLVAAREAQRGALREAIDSAIEQGGDNTLEDMQALVADLAAASRAKGR